MKGKYKLLIAVGIVLDCILIVVFVVWLLYSKSKSEFDLLAKKLQKAQTSNRDLFSRLEDFAKGLDIEYTGDVVLSISNMVLNKLESSYFPIEIPLKGNVEGIVRIEELSSFQFVGERRLLFRMKIVGKDLRYNPRGDSFVDNMLSGFEFREEIVLQGTGEIHFIFDRENQRLDFRIDIEGIDFQTGLPQFLEKKIKEGFVKQLKNQPHYVEFSSLKPLMINLGNKKGYGRYHIRDVIAKKNRLMAIADLVFVETEDKPSEK